MTLTTKRISEQTVAAVCLMLSFLASSAQAAWMPVMEDSIDVKLQVSCLSLDTTHFVGPTLLIGTYRDTSGQSLILTVEPTTLAILDTIYRSPFVANVIRAVDLNDDSSIDFLVALTSVYGDPAAYSELVAIYGPDYSAADTLRLPRGVRDLAVDENKKEFWLGYSHDTTIVTPSGGTAWVSSSLVGFMGTFDFNLSQRRDLGDSLAGQAFALTDVNSDGVADVVALWLMGYSGYCVGCAGPAPDPAWVATGLWMMDGLTESTLYKNWVELGSRANSDLRNSMILYGQFPVIDLSGDGRAEGVLSWYWRHSNYAGGPDVHDYFAEVYSLSDGQRLWKKALSFGSSWPYTVIPYYMHTSAPPILLFIGGSGFDLHARDGATGDSLFAAGFRFVSHLNVPMTNPSWDRTRVFHASESWLYRWRIDLGASRDDPASVIPSRFLLRANSPNPFNAETRISYTLAYPMEVDLIIFDALGRRIRRLETSRQSAGDHETVWDGKNDQDQNVPSGVYFLRLSSQGQELVRKMALVK